jgi:Carboxypeptidase regulatory-like domain
VNSLHRARRAYRSFQIFFLTGLLFISTLALADAVGRGAGVVRDGSGAVVSGAKVTLTRTSTNAVLTRTTDGSGTFQFLELPPDTYTLSVEAPGFKRTTLSRVVIQVDQASTLDVVLQLGQVSEVLNVDAAPPLIDTQQNTLSNVIDSQAITTMPLNSRNFLDLALLTPGATPSAGGSQVTGFNVAGARTQSNDYLIDGISNMDTQVNGGLTSFRINDAVQEFSVQTSVPTAEFGRGQGAQINAVIKSGTNQFHGSAFEYFRNTILDATDYFSKYTAGGIKPVLNRNQFGATLGGPIWRDKTFFFLSYEGFRQVAPTVSAVLVPTPTQRASVKDPISKQLLAYFPLSQQPGDTLAANGTNYQSNVRSVLNDDTGLVRIDETLTPHDTLSGHFITYNGRVISGGPTPLSGGNTNTPLSQSVFIEENHTFSPTLLNTLRFGYSFNQTNFVVQDYGFNAQSIFTDPSGNPLPGVVNATTTPIDSGLPTVQIAGFARLGSATNLPQGRKTRTYEIYDTFSSASLFGSTKHAIKAGFHVRREDARRFLDGTSRGSVNFSNTASAALGLTAAQTSFNDFAVGLINTSTLRSGSTLAHYRRYPMDMFLQDQWKILPNLTLNLGIRYELPSAIYELDDRAANLIAGQGVTLFGTNSVLDIDTTKVGPSSIIYHQGAITMSNSGQLTVDRNNVAPVLGFAWSPYPGSDRTVLRGGFRVGYDDIFNNIPANQSLNPPFNITTTQASGVTQAGKFSYATAFNQNVPLVKNVGKQGPGTPTVGLLSFNGMDPYIRSSYNYAYSLSVEQRLNDRVSLELDYIGSLGRKLGIFVDPNQPNVIVRDSTKRGTASPNEQVFPYNHYGSFSDSYGRAAVNSNYSGAVAVVKYHGAHGVAAQGSYTWSHSLDYSSAFFGSTGDFGYPSNGNNLKAEYGNSSFDMRHRFVGYYTIPLPFGPGQKFLTSKNIVSREAFEGWTVSGITEIQSGLPFTVYLGGTDYSGFNQFADRPNTGTGKLTQHNKSPGGAFDTTYFSTITAGQVGTERRDQYYGPGLVNFDLATAKDFPLSERFRLNFRADLFNIFNHTNFSNPVATFTSSSFGKITSTVGNATSGTGGAIGGARLAQFALRLNF